MNTTVNFSVDILEKIKNKESVNFTATRSELKFENIESDLSTQNFDFPFYLPNMYLQSEYSILAHAALGMVDISLLDRIRLLTNIYEGKMIYQKVGNGDTWKVAIQF